MNYVRNVIASHRCLLMTGSGFSVHMQWCDNGIHYYIFDPDFPVLSIPGESTSLPIHDLELELFTATAYIVSDFDSESYTMTNPALSRNQPGNVSIL